MAGRTDTSALSAQSKGTALRVVRHELRLSGSTHRERADTLSAAFQAFKDHPVRRRALMDIHQIVLRYQEEQER
jgi:hypothetical protein